MQEDAADAGARGSGERLSLRLRAETAAAHQALEDHLDLLRPGLTQAETKAVLAGFRGFHAVWEPALARRPELAAALAGRARLALLDGDLARLGLSAAAVAALPRCEAAAALAADTATGLGSLYVLEGSTLGGQVIARRLAGADWWPAEGLRYFDPYGSETGRRWRALQELLDAQPVERANAVVAGATATFALLRDWLPGRRRTGSG